MQWLISMIFTIYCCHISTFSTNWFKTCGAGLDASWWISTILGVQGNRTKSSQNDSSLWRIRHAVLQKLSKPFLMNSSKRTETIWLMLVVITIQAPWWSSQSLMGHCVFLLTSPCKPLYFNYLFIMHFIEDQLNTMEGEKVYTTRYLSKRYHQILLNPDLNQSRLLIHTVFLVESPFTY